MDWKQPCHLSLSNSQSCRNNLDKTGMTSLFPYAAVFVFLSSVTMLFVRHGDSKPIPAGKLESFDAGD